MTYNLDFFLLAEDVASKLFEGDIQLAPEDLDFLSQSGKDKNIRKRNAHRTRQRLWRTKIIPYEIDNELGETICFN
jgi:hypothetical protein